MKMVALGEVASVRSSLVNPTDAAFRDLPHIAPDTIERDTGRLFSYSSVQLAGVTSGKYRFEPGDVLYSKIRPNLNKVALVNFEGLCSADMYALDVDSSCLINSYLEHLLRGPQFVGYATNLSGRANIPKVNRDQLLRYRFSLPPLDEQRRIAAILDHADALRVKRRKVLAGVDALSQSIFLNMFGEPRSWPGRWPMGTIGDLAESVQYGTSGKAGDSGEWPYARMGNITDDGRLDLSDLKWIDLPENEIPKFTVKRGDLLFNRTNSREKVGKTCVVDTDEPLAFAGYLIRVRFKRVHQPEYVNAFMTSHYGRAVRYGMAKAAINQANINATEMQSIRIAMPSRELQAQFAEAVGQVNEQRSCHRHALAEFDNLFTSLQSRAFRGEL